MLPTHRLRYLPTILGIFPSWQQLQTHVVFRCSPIMILENLPPKRLLSHGSRGPIIASLSSPTSATSSEVNLSIETERSLYDARKPAPTESVLQFRSYCSSAPYCSSAGLYVQLWWNDPMHHRGIGGWLRPAHDKHQIA